MRLAVFCVIPLLTAAALADPPWSPNVLACRVGADSLNEGESCIAADGDYIYCISNVNERSRVAVIPYGRSTDGGATWTSSWWVDSTAPNMWHTDPVLLCDDTGYVHMFVQYSTTVLRHYLSTDHGLTWCDTADVSSGSVDKPWCCYYGNNLYAAWQNVGSNAGIYFAKSTDGGRSWNQRRVDTRTGITGICTSPSGIIFLMNRYWSGNSVHFTRSTDQGETWSPWVTVATGCSYTEGYGDRAPLPSIAAPTDSHVFLTWVNDATGGWDIIYSRSSDAGQTWTSPARLNDSAAGGQCKGWVTADPAGGLHMLWYHTPSWPTSASSWWSLRYTHSDDYGATIQPSIRLTDTIFRSPVSFIGEYHIMVADSQFVRAVWADGRDGDLDLFFAQAELSAIGVEENPFQVFRRPRVWLELPAVALELTTARFGLRDPARAVITVYDALGRRRNSFDFGDLNAGTYARLLTGLPKGQPLFVRLDAGESVTRRLTVVR